MGSQKLINLLIVLIGVFVIYVIGNSVYTTYFKPQKVSNIPKNYIPYTEDPNQKESARKIKEFQAQNSPMPIDSSLIEPEGDCKTGEFILENCYEALFSGIKQSEYEIIKIKVKNICENKIEPLYNAIKGLDAAGKNDYFNKNKNYIDKYFGIEKVEDFIVFADSLKFMNAKIKKASINPDTIEISSEKVTFDIEIILENNSKGTYKIVAHLFKTNEYQGSPYVTIAK